MGANIGTTITSQLVAFNLSQIAPVFLMLGVIIVMFCKKVQVKVSRGYSGLCVLFMMDFSLMSESMAGLEGILHLSSVY